MGRSRSLSACGDMRSMRAAVDAAEVSSFPRQGRGFTPQNVEGDSPAADSPLESGRSPSVQHRPVSPRPGMMTRGHSAPSLLSSPGRRGLAEEPSVAPGYLQPNRQPDADEPAFRASPVPFIELDAQPPLPRPPAHQSFATPQHGSLSGLQLPQASGQAAYWQPAADGSPGQPGSPATVYPGSPTVASGQVASVFQHAVQPAGGMPGLGFSWPPAAPAAPLGTFSAQPAPQAAAAAAPTEVYPALAPAGWTPVAALGAGSSLYQGTVLAVRARDGAAVLLF